MTTATGLRRGNGGVQRVSGEVTERLAHAEDGGEVSSDGGRRASAASARARGRIPASNSVVRASGHRAFRGFQCGSSSRAGTGRLSEVRVDCLARSAGMGGGVAACAHGGGMVSMSCHGMVAKWVRKRGQRVSLVQRGVLGFQGSEG